MPDAQCPIREALIDRVEALAGFVTAGDQTCFESIHARFECGTLADDDTIVENEQPPI